MAKENKIFPKRINVRELRTPAGEKAPEAKIVQGITEFSNTLTMDMAAFFTGNANNGKDMKTAQQKAKSNNKSLLGEKDSIYSFLQEIKMSLSGKEVKEMIPKSLLLMGANSSLIKNALMNEEGQTAIELLDEILATDINVLKNSLEEFSEAIASFKDELKNRYDLYEKTYKHQRETIDRIIDLKDAYKSGAEATLKLTIEGIDASTIDSLIKFSQINLSGLDNNAKNLTVLFESLKILSDQNIKHKNVLNGIAGINEILSTLILSAPLFKIVNFLYSTKNDSKDKYHLINLDNTTKIFNSFGKLFNELDTIKTSNNIKQLVGSFGSLFIMLQSIITLIPLLGLINNSFDTTDNKGKYKVNLEKTSEILIDFNNLIFDTINHINPINDGFKKIKSFITFHLIAGGLKSSLLAISALKLGDLDNKKLFLTSVALKNISIVFDIINKMKTLDKDTKKKINDVAQLFGDPKKVKDNQSNKYINTSLAQIFENISKTEIPEKTSLTGITNFVSNIKTIIDSLNSIQEVSKNPEEISKNIDDYLKVLEESYKKIEEKFEQIIGAGDKAEQAKAANEKIANVLESTNETIVKTSSNQEDIKKSVISIEGMTEFMIGAAIVMSIGALFVAIGGGEFVKNALEFGIVLAIFEGLVLMPALMFYEQENSAMMGIQNFNSFIVTCTIIMSIGALFMALSNGKFAKNALEFGIVLFMFETLTVMPMLMFLGLKTDIFKSMSNFSTFIIATTIIMSVGALFVSLGGGKFVRNALKFGIILAKFEFMVIAPFLLFGLISNKVTDNVKNFTALLITTTILFLIGSGVMAMSGGKMVQYAMDFAVTLMKFEAMIIAPFLIFNFLRKSVFDGLKAFTSVVIVCTTALLIGALFMNMKNGSYKLAAMEFAWLLMKFETMIIAPFLLFNIIQKPVFKGLRDFAIVVFVATTTLLIGSMFMTMNNGEMWKYALGFAGVLFAFEVALLVPILGFGKLNGKPLQNAREFGLFVALCSFSLIIGAFFIKQYGFGPAWKFAILLGIFVGAMSGVVMWLEDRFKDRKAIEKAEEFGIFILLCSSALIIGALFVNKYGVGPVLAFGVVLVAFVGLMSAVVFGLNKMFESTGGVEKPIALMVAMGTFLILATGSLALGAWVVDTYGWKALAFVPLLMGFVVGIGAIFALIGLPPLFALIGLGAIAATAMGVALLALTGSIMIVNLLFELDPGGKKTRKNIETLNDDVLWGIMGTFTLLGLLSPLIIPGGLAAIAIGVAMMALGGSLLIINTCVDKVKDTILGNIVTLGEVIIGIGILGLELFAMIIPLTLGLPGLALLNVFSLGLTTSILMMYGSIKAMQSVGGDLTKQIDLIVKNLQAFIDIPNKISLGGKDSIPFLGAVWNGGKLFTLNLMMSDITGIVKNAAYAIREIQSLKFNENFNTIKDKIFNILTTLPQSFLDVYSGKNGGKGLKDIDQYKINRIILFSKSIGEVISGVAEGVDNMAKLQIPIGWDKNGKPISFRKLNEKDFTSAGDNVAIILTTMAATLGHLWNNDVDVKIGNFDYTLKGGLHNLLDDKDSPFFNMISFSKQIGEVISGIAEGVASMAKLKIPISWDTNGKPNGYKSLKDKDFIDAANNTQIILSTIITAMAGLYESHRNDKGGNIFDMEDNWFTEDSPSPIMRVIETSFKISELLGNLGGGIKSIATLQIPTKWDTNGKPIYYETLKPTDFANAGQAVGQIVTCIIDALNKESYIENSDDIKKVLEAVLPVSELISGMADGIIKLSSGMIPDEWNDPKHPGRATHYKPLKPTDYVRSGKTIAQIVTCISNALIKAYNGKNGNDGLKSILESDSFKDIVESVASTGDLISNIADSVIKIGSAQIPVYKNGKIDHYDKMNIPEAKTNLSNVIREIMLATIDSIIDVYNGDPGKNNGLNQLLKDENSQFLQATKGINEVMQSVSIITDSIIKLGSAQIPVYKNGKIDTYKSISVNDTIAKIKNIFQGDGQGNGLLTVLCTEIIKIANQYFNPNDENKNISGAVSSVYNGIHQIMNIVDDVTKIITNIGNLKFPTKFDKNGKPTEYSQIDKNILDTAKKNIVDVMTSILSIFDISSTNPNPLKPYLEKKNIIDPEHKQNIIDNLNDTKEIISSLSVIVKEFNTYGEGFAKILKYKGSGVKSEKTISLAVLNDAYLIIKAFNEFNSGFNEDVQQNQNLSKIAGNIEAIGSDMIRIVVKVSEISKVISDNKLSEITKNFDGNSLASSLSTIMNGFNVIYKTMTSPLGDDNGKYVLLGSLDQKVTHQLGLNVSTISSLTNTLIDNYIKNLEKIGNVPDLNNDYTTKLDNIKAFYVKVISVIKGINDELLKNIQVQVKEGSNTDQVMHTISDFILSGINPFDSEMFEKFDNLNTSINDIYESIISQHDHSNEFNANTNALQKYIKAINTVDTSKLKPLTTLVHELNNLADKLGSLDKVADTLSNDLAVVLKNLVDSLTEAKDTIDSAHQLQGDRHKKIEEAINTVRNLMDSPLKINVSTESSSTTGPNSIVTPENNKQNSSSGPIILSGGSGGSNRNNSNTPPTRDKK